MAGNSSGMPQTLEQVTHDTIIKSGVAAAEQLMRVAMELRARADACVALAEDLEVHADKNAEMAASYIALCRSAAKMCQELALSGQAETPVSRLALQAVADSIGKDEK